MSKLVEPPRRTHQVASRGALIALGEFEEAIEVGDVELF
jgi:hypothetical protein